MKGKNKNMLEILLLEDFRVVNNMTELQPRDIYKKIRLYPKPIRCNGKSTMELGKRKVMK